MGNPPRDEVIAVCSAKPGSAEDYASGDEVAVFKVAGKMFALVTVDPAPAAPASNATRISRSARDADTHAITAGYHLSKRHRNTVMLDGSVPQDELLDLIDHPYELAVTRLPGAERDKVCGLSESAHFFPALLVVLSWQRYGSHMWNLGRANAACAGTDSGSSPSLSCLPTTPAAAPSRYG